jgi:hypothetical protein
MGSVDLINPSVQIYSPSNWFGLANVLSFKAKPSYCVERILASPKWSNHMQAKSLTPEQMEARVARFDKLHTY